ncbi:mannose-1-phosphate guanylyltransferase/mannose-6-phosphate isomerase [Microvirga sp. VF16]|uniref:mannose-1-phosphate guanylyltransferase/mannose-6-phosphate isomerase n=1 Tax=Microvirga sp. VF16 TaxID=2807101 RepID=UPI00193E5D65|nr:mannose-1-phosphate guanylyltransferase/mannose-6-phosphate isomerase [Microvirga sp. VF16]QRM31741.1 mannose-1-phosphate guanylyltransferase/mannose-6-phosphate isomerase [Microvirga sp. VF16]
MSLITPVLMSGGTGSRLWPLSREAYPKQLLPLLGQGSLLQETLRRVSGQPLFGAPLVIANAEHRFLIAEQLREMGCADATLLLEPFGRNTCPAAAVAAILASRQDPDSLILLMPVDHCIGNVPEFQAAIEAGRTAAEQGHFVLFGMTPKAPATGYGYIQCGECLEDSRIRQVLGFKEKPDASTAKSYVESGTYSWNSGIFLLPTRRFLEELRRLEPRLLQACTQSVDKATVDLDFLRLDPSSFQNIPDISIDYAVMEKTSLAVVVPMDCAWSDVGAWSALWDLASKDQDGTVSLGDVVALDSSGCYLRSDGPLVAAVGIQDLIVVATQDAILVAQKERDQDVKKLVDQLKARGHDSAVQTTRVHRPWGFYQSLHMGERFQVKRITVKPGEKLSLQKHYHRAEHWIVVNGTALVTRDNEQILLRENESVYLPLGCVHRLENPGRVLLNLIEVQSGAYLGEDDIVRLEDVYARDSNDGFERMRHRLTVA